MKDERYKKTNIASILGILGNIFLFCIKSVIGFFTNSMSMIADAFNSGSDILSSLMTFIGNKIASKPKDKKHNLGYGKAEYIYALLISIVMFLLAITTFKNSLVSLFNPEKYHFSIWLIIVCIITIITKLCLYIYTNKVAKKHNNLLIKANSKDHFNDCIITAFNLLACLLSYFNIYVFDSFIGMGISLWIIYTAYLIFKESYDILMDKSINKDTKKKVESIINRHKEIKKINHFNSTPVGYRYQVSFSIFLDGNMSTFDSHKIADIIEKEIEKEIPEIYLTIIHVNPYMED